MYLSKKAEDIDVLRELKSSLFTFIATKEKMSIFQRNLGVHKK